MSFYLLDGAILRDYASQFVNKRSHISGRGLEILSGVVKGDLWVKININMFIVLIVKRS